MNNNKLNKETELQELKDCFTYLQLDEESGNHTYESSKMIYGMLLEDLRKYQQTGCHGLRIYFLVGTCSFSYQYAADPVAAQFMDLMGKKNLPPEWSRVVATEKLQRPEGGNR